MAPATATGPGRRSGAFEGMPAEAFSFLTDLTRHNTHEWFGAHRDRYQRALARPWRSLAAALTASVQTWLPEIDGRVQSGHVLSRINRHWPRPDAAYRTGLRATWALAGAGRPPAAALFVTLEATGIGAGVEVLAGTAAWEHLRERLPAADALWAAAQAAGLRPLLTGEDLTGRDAGAVAEAMAMARRRGGIRCTAAWSAEDAVASGPALVAAMLEALRAAVPLYLCAADPGPQWAERLVRLDGGPADVPGATPVPPVVAARDLVAATTEPGDGALPLPRSLRAALAAQAAAEGVSAEALAIYLLARGLGA